MRVDFTYHHLGATYDVAATFTPGLYGASADGPYDDEATLDDIEAIGPDGNDWYGEFKYIFTRDRSLVKRFPVEMVSIAELIDREAYNQLQVAA